MRTYEEGYNYARKAMNLCCISPDYDGVWMVDKVKPELRKLIAKYQQLFDAVIDWSFVEDGNGDEDGDIKEEVDSAEDGDSA